MPVKYVVDTHALVWFLEGNPRLGTAAKAVLEDPHSELFLPIIALAEACWLVEHGRTSIPAVDNLMGAIESDPRLAVLPLDTSLVKRTVPLRQIEEMHDRQIVATGLWLRECGETVVMLTKDSSIKASGALATCW